MAEELVFTLNPICLPDKVPEIRVWNKHRSMTYSLDRKLDLDFDIHHGKNFLQIDFLNKSRFDTKLSDGKIIADLAVVIERIDYRGFDFLPYIDQLGEYRKEIDDSIVQGTHGFMAFAGRFRFNIRGPLFILSRDLGIIHGQ